MRRLWLPSRRPSPTPFILRLISWLLERSRLFVAIFMSRYPGWSRLNRRTPIQRYGCATSPFDYIYVLCLSENNDAEKFHTTHCTVGQKLCEIRSRLWLYRLAFRTPSMRHMMTMNRISSRCRHHLSPLSTVSLKRRDKMSPAVGWQAERPSQSQRNRLSYWLEPGLRQVCHQIGFLVLFRSVSLWKRCSVRYWANTPIDSTTAHQKVWRKSQRNTPGTKRTFKFKLILTCSTWVTHPYLETFCSVQAGA